MAHQVGTGREEPRVQMEVCLNERLALAPFFLSGIDASLIVNGREMSLGMSQASGEVKRATGRSSL